MKYVPILKFKFGEQQALKNLNASISDVICPLFEIHRPKAGVNINAQIAACWNNRPFFFYIMPDWYDDCDGINELINNQEEIFSSLCKDKNATPVLDLSMLDIITDWSFLPQQGIAVRVRNNEFADIESILNPIFSSSQLKRDTTDLIIDLQYTHPNDLFSKETILKAVIPYIEKISEYRAVIIASCAFPETLPDMDINRIYRFPRTEKEIHAKAKELSLRFNFNYVYSDYGPTNLQEIQFVVGMSPNFKIKYSTKDEYLYIKGISLKRGGLDIGNISALCSTLVNTSDFSGEDFSWADSLIFNLANGTAKSGGNLTTWVSYSMNHHITLISSIL